MFCVEWSSSWTYEQHVNEFVMAQQHILVRPSVFVVQNEKWSRYILVLSRLFMMNTDKALINTHAALMKNGVDWYIVPQKNTSRAL